MRPRRAGAADEERGVEGRRADQELLELLNELRVALPGVQVIFAFLLTVPFTQQWDRVTELQRNVYFATLLLTLGASLMLIAPSAHHRLYGPRLDMKDLLRRSNRFAIVGLVLLSLAMTGAVMLITDLLYETGAATVTAGATAGAFAWVWFVMPCVHRVRAERGQRR